MAKTTRTKKNKAKYNSKHDMLPNSIGQTMMMGAGATTTSSGLKMKAQPGDMPMIPANFIPEKGG